MDKTWRDQGHLRPRPLAGDGPLRRGWQL